MSDNEFFFDDEKAAEPAPKTKPAPGGAVKKKPAPKSAPRPAVAPVSGAVVEQQSVTITIAVLIAVVALLIGVIAGIFIGRAMVPEAVGTPVTPTTSTMGTGGAGTGGTGPAPALTEEQIKAGMPAGHVSTEATTTP